jgi:spermidine/putrescine transport system substrate-binding protein
MAMRKSSKGMIAIIASAALFVLTSCGGSGSSSAKLDADADLASQKLTVSIWAAYSPEDLPSKFEEKFGTKVTITNHATNEEVMAKLTAGGDSGIDVAFVSGQFAQALAQQGLIENLDKSFIPNSANLVPEVANLTYDLGNKYSMPYAWGTTGICYRADLLKGNEPTSWNDLLLPKPQFKGKVTMLATERWLMLPAQKALGFSANTQDESEMNQVKDLLIKAKANLLAYDDTTFYERLVSGEAVMVEAWDGWCNYGIAKNKNIKFMVPKEGSDLWADTMVVLKSSKNKEAAHAFINYILDKDVHSWVVDNILYKVPNSAAMEKSLPALAADFPNMTISPSELLKGEGLVDLGKAAPLYTRIATEVTAK